MKYLIGIFYLLSIVLANVFTAKFAPVKIFIFLIPIGTFFIGLTFLLRDFFQIKFGKYKSYLLIFSAVILSAMISFMMSDTIFIAFYSFIAFLLSETIDTEIFSRFKSNLTNRILFSGFVGGLVDSFIFVFFALSPIGSNFVSWEFIHLAIIGQFLIKFFVQVLVLILINRRIKNAD